MAGKNDFGSKSEEAKRLSAERLAKQKARDKPSVTKGSGVHTDGRGQSGQPKSG